MPPSPPNLIACPGCGKSYSLPDRPPATFACKACGTAMDLSGFAAAPSADESSDEIDDGARRAANVELARAERSIQAVQMVFVVGAGLCGILTFVTLALPVNPDVRSNLLLSTGLSACFMGAGAAFCRQNPYAWSLALACAATLGVVVGFLIGSIPWVQAIVMLGGWGAVSQSARSRALLAAHPELKRSRAARGAGPRRAKRVRKSERGGRRA